MSASLYAKAFEYSINRSNFASDIGKTEVESRADSTGFKPEGLLFIPDGTIMTLGGN